MSTASDISAIDQSTPHLPRAYYPALSAASMTLWAMILGPVLTTIPNQIAAISPGNHITALAIVTASGGIVGIITNPLIGRLSDATATRLGRRRPWIIGGILITIPAAIGAGTAESLIALTLWWSLLQVGANMLMAPLTATIPDLVPEHRRGLATACLGISWAFAPVLGTAVQAIVGEPFVTYLVLAVLIALTHLLFLLTLRGDQARTPTPQRAVTARPKGPRAGQRDFTLAWTHRLLFALGQNIAITYLFFYLQDVIHYEAQNPGSTTDDGVLLLTAIYAPAVVVAALIAGALSDRAHRYRIYIIGATTLFAAGAFLGAVTGSWEGVLVLAALTGLGFGAYEAVSMAMVIALLPDEERRARDLSFINVATLISIAIAPVIAAALINLVGYAFMFVIAGLAVLGSGMVVMFIRGTR